MRRDPFDTEPLSDKVTITICSKAYTGQKYLAFSNIAADKNLAARVAKNFGQRPNIDKYKLLSGTVVHEVSIVT